MRIRQVFLSSVALGSVVGAVAALLFVLQQWTGLEAGWRVVHDTRLLGSALHLPEMMNMERALLSVRLAEAPAATERQRDVIRRQIALVDQAIGDTIRLAPTAADRGALEDVAARLRVLRRSALGEIDRPGDERIDGGVEPYVKKMFAIQEQAYALANNIQMKINGLDPAAGQVTHLAVLAWDVRDWSGRQVTTLISYIARGLPMGGEQAETIALFKGRIELKWLAARNIAVQMRRPELMAAVDAVEQGFWNGGGEAYATYVAPNRGQVLTIDADHFVPAIRVVLDRVLLLRDAAITEASLLAHERLTLLRWRFLLAVGLAALTGMATAAATFWFNHRVVQPIRRITKIILALAEGNREVAVPLRERHDELGQMAAAIETLRCNARRADAVAREMLSLQQVRAEEKARLLVELTESHEELKSLNQELSSLAATDALTGVANRRSFDIALGRELRQAQQDATTLGLVMLDIDHFKLFNDGYGHQAGDICLVRVASAIAGAVRLPADLVARYGGEEFAVLLPDAGQDEAVLVAERVRRAVAGLKIAHAGSPSRFVTVSLGVAVAAGAHTAEALVAQADQALYGAKRGGRNRVTMAASRAELEAVPGG